MGGPALDVEVEGADIRDDSRGAQSWLPVATGIDRGSPCLVGLLGQREVGLGGVDRLDLSPEEVAQVAGKPSQGRVVEVVAAAGQVERQHLGYIQVGQLIGVDQLRGCHRGGAHRAAQRGGDTGREVSGLVQHLPGEVSDVVLIASAVAAAAGLDRVVQQPLGAQISQLDALGGQGAGDIEPRAALVVRRGTGLIDKFHEPVQVWIGLGGLEELKIVLEPTRAERGQRRADHPQPEENLQRMSCVLTLRRQREEIANLGSARVQSGREPPLLPGLARMLGQEREQGTQSGAAF